MTLGAVILVKVGTKLRKAFLQHKTEKALLFQAFNLKADAAYNFKFWIPLSVFNKNMDYTGKQNTLNLPSWFELKTENIPLDEKPKFVQD